MTTYQWCRRGYKEPSQGHGQRQTDVRTDQNAIREGKYVNKQ